MPILKHAIKKQRVDKRRTEVNKQVRSQLKKAIKASRLKPEDATVLSSAYSAIDLAAKKRIIHPGKADRLKSRLTKVTAKTSPKPKAKPKAKAKAASKTKK